jgi:putative transposase
MRAAGLLGACRRRRGVTVRDPRAAAPAPDLVKRQFRAAGPDRLGVADLKQSPTREGGLDLGVVLDVWSRGVVGWAMRPDARAELVGDALEMARWRRKPAPGLVPHSDRGAQYTSLRFGARLRAAEILPSRGRKGDAYDNALCEAFFATLEREVLDRHRFHTREEARSVLFSYLEGSYNRRRRHSALGYLSPEEFERRWWTGHESLSATLSTKVGQVQTMAWTRASAAARPPWAGRKRASVIVVEMTPRAAPMTREATASPTRSSVRARLRARLCRPVCGCRRQDRACMRVTSLPGGDMEACAGEKDRLARGAGEADSVARGGYLAAKRMGMTSAFPIR